MQKILAIDPGTTESCYVVWDGRKVWDHGKITNVRLLNYTRRPIFKDIMFIVLEEFRSYGMSIGQSTIDSIFWSGQFAEAFKGEFHLLQRVEVKKHLCHTGAAKDTNVKQALVDRFAYGVRNHGKGVKADPGFFYGFVGDTFAAMGVAVTWYDQNIK